MGLIGSIIALLMYSSPITTFRRIIRKGSTEDFSGTPYAIALFNCLIYSLYGSPLISNEWDNALVMFVNCIGLVLECCFIAIFLIFAPSRTKCTVLLAIDLFEFAFSVSNLQGPSLVLTARMVVGVVMVFGSIATVSFVAMHDRKHKQFLVGTAGMVATVVLYSAPLSIIKLVIQTKSVEFMPFNLSFFAFAASLLWLAYGFIAKDIMIMAPNFVGLPLGLAQMVIYCIYRGKSVQIREEINDQGDKVFTETTEYPAYPDVEMQLEEKSVTLAHEVVVEMK
ncbi:bidirectional sugar transporter SWEET3b-like [Cryptomeria japonica]|uniref:bidirectional sugar transporter SWEET3b-like n=1 Tax=Cryptomeria japonica TaxID=3369 RepID=UPI0027DA4069|nr:bidirectional sugar transporter SWEET3b-like [Cryptomeria japonica]